MSGRSGPGAPGGSTVAGHDVRRALADAEPVCFWLEDPSAPGPAEALVGRVDTDLLVVGGGYTGLWTALLAKETDPARDVVLLEGHTAGWAASGRNGGVCDARLAPGVGQRGGRFAHQPPPPLGPRAGDPPRHPATPSPAR